MFTPRSDRWRSPGRSHSVAPFRPLVLGLTLLLALLLGGGIELLAHHDHDPFVADSGCLLCRLADAPVDGAPPAPVVPEVFEAPAESSPFAPDLHLPESPGNSAHPLRGPPLA